MSALCVLGVCIVAMGNAAQTAAPARPPPPSSAGGGEPLDQVLLRVKQEIGLYSERSKAWRTTYGDDFQRLGITPQCGNGKINFAIRSVKMQFEAVMERTSGGEFGFTIPFGEFGPNGKVEASNRTTSTVEYTYYVPETVGQTDPAAESNIKDAAVIAPTLSALRDGLIRATAQYPCMANTPGDKDDTFSFEVELKDVAEGKAGFKFVVVSAGVSVDQTRSHRNTITVTFHPISTSADHEAAPR